MKTNNSNRSLLTTLLIIIVLIGAFIGGYLFASSYNNDKQQNEENNEKEKIQKLEPTDKLVTDSIAKLSYNFDCKWYNYDYLTDKELKANDLTNDQVYNMALQTISNEVMKDNGNGYDYYDFDANKLRSAIDAIVGKNYQFTNSTYTTCPTWEYDSVSSTYKKPTISACGCTTGPYHNLIKVSKAEKNSSELKIYLNALFVDDEGIYYKDRAFTQKIEGLTYKNENGLKIVDETASNFEKGRLYEITFKLEDGNYVFYSSKPTK